VPFIMASLRVLSGLTALAGMVSSTRAQEYADEDLILCDCGIGDNEAQPDWSTSRQINWYEDIEWPDSAYSYPDAPDKVVEVPFNEGVYPWTPAGVTATLSNGDIWTIYIEDGTPDGFKAGTAVGTKEGGQSLNCWAYRGRPVSAAINTTVNADAICWSAFVCNRDDEAPPRPDDMTNPTTTPATESAPPTSSVFSTQPTNPPKPTADPENPEPSPTEGEPEPTEAPQTGNLLVNAGVNPRFINWPNTWSSFISNFIWDQGTGQCVGAPIRGDGYNITVECSGIQLDQDTHMTLLMIKALHDVGLNSLWFNQNPTIPAGTSNQGNSTNWVVMPESVSLSATDVATNNVIGKISYSTKYDGFLAGPCSTCETGRFDEAFFDPLLLAVQGSYPSYWSFTVQANCDPWIVCQ
jgi:hypothetical protein